MEKEKWHYVEAVLLFLYTTKKCKVDYLKFIYFIEDLYNDFNVKLDRIDFCKSYFRKGYLKLDPVFKIKKDILKQLKEIDLKQYDFNCLICYGNKGYISISFGECPNSNNAWEGYSLSIDATSLSLTQEKEEEIFNKLIQFFGKENIHFIVTSKDEKIYFNQE